MYAYALAACSIFLSRKWRDVTNLHLSLLLLSAFNVYIYLDVWPLAAIDAPEPDVSRSWSTWTRVGILGFAGVLIPLTSPRPFRPKDPQDLPSPEDTCSLLSSLTYSYLDQIIFYAYSVPNTTIDDLPRLPVSESASILAEKNLPKFDPVKVGLKRHVFWGLLRVFAPNYTRALVCVLALSFTQFSSPLGMEKLLSYLEGGHPRAGLHPWVWVVLIAVGPMVAGFISNQYLYESTIIIVESESLLTQLVFEHSLRIRMSSDFLSGDDGVKDFSDSDALSSSTTPTAVEEVTAGDAFNADESLANEGQTPRGSSDTRTNKEKTPIKEKSARLLGRINNLLTTDLNQIAETQDVLMILRVFIQVTMAMIFLYYIIGWSAFVGMGVIVICLPVPVYIGKLVMEAQKGKMAKTDERVQAVTEIMNVLRMVKLFAWEIKMLDQITKKREDELRWIRYGKLLDYLVLNNSNSIIPLLSMLGAFGSYTLIMQKPLIASVAFPGITVFNILTEQLFNLVWLLPKALKVKVSMDRLNEFLNKTELLDNSTESDISAAASPVQNEDVIGFNAVTFSWTDINKSQPETPASRTFRLHFDREIIFKRGGINLIIGPTASGKTSLLMALLGEMYCKPLGPASWFNLPRNGGVAYAAQESWVLNETVRENILFGQPFNEERYLKVLNQCALERDLSLWEAGDMTEIGEKGLTLSGGQKARVTFARALYSRADTLLLDDVLAALDVHTAKWVVEKAFKGDLVSGRTVILVTHNVALTSSIADFVVTLGKNGRVSDFGSITDVLSLDANLRATYEKEKALAEKTEIDKESAMDEEGKTKSGKLVVPEEKAEGRVERAAMMLFIRGFGGSLFWGFTFSSKVFARIFNISGPIWIAYWSSQYAVREHVPALRYLALAAFLHLITMAFGSLSQLCWVFGSMKAARTIHYQLLKSIFNAPLRWLDTVPVGRVITRCTQDVDAVDTEFSTMSSTFIDMSIALLLNFVLSIYMAGWVALISGGLMASLGGWLGAVYLKAQLSMRRETSNAKSPVMSQVGAALLGLPSIRAYKAQSQFRSDLQKRLDVYIRANLTFYTLNRWIAIRADTLGAMFCAVVASFLVYWTDVRAGSVGLTLTVVTGFTGQILWWVRVYNILEIEANSLERILGFLRIEHEPERMEDRKPPAYWPSSGSLRVEGLSARYSDDGPEVLQDLNFDVTSGERIGVVGRTGAGKSSFALALLRAIKTSGTVHYDGIPTHSINLDALRSSITLIPQQPELLHGTLRKNLDPFGQYDDSTLNDALQSAGLFQLQDLRKGPVSDGSDMTPASEEGRAAVGLDTQVDAGGTNFSLGQRQIIALARAIVRQSKLLILDEATAAIDYETDSAIRHSLRTELGKDTTVITIAHRLQTIMDSDRIMVLESGRLVEYDSPKSLLQMEDGVLRSLVDESHDSAYLKELAGI
ncbi:P-loop containing nucleoside triphosphate hydrolase protein [Rickenella mellea]|uniref:P-loop containing nucleoside triphosphate hydrolase protein n=1 Tax=Rickenella mellea TaxID=50990 RepID=A0A4Y7Q2C5_9AGAM|nr:P-loop containing nucleoside triphosphate hydrolase protein [Rickenella mellea]